MSNPSMRGKIEKAARQLSNAKFQLSESERVQSFNDLIKGVPSKTQMRAENLTLDLSQVRKVPPGAASGLSNSFSQEGKGKARIYKHTYGDGTRLGHALVWAR